MTTDDFDLLLLQARAALDNIVKGDPDGYRDLYSRREDITLGNPFGGFARGWEQVVEQLERGASYYRDGQTVGFETVAELLSPDWAYTVEIERFKAKVGEAPTSANLHFGSRASIAAKPMAGSWCTGTLIRGCRVNPLHP